MNRRKVVLMLLIVAQGFTALAQLDLGGETRTRLRTQLDSISYAYGVSIGKSLKDANITLNNDLVAKGLSDFQQNILLMEKDEVGELLAILQKNAYLAEQERISKIAKKNHDEEAPFFEANMKKKNITTTLSGLQYEIIAKGNTVESPPTMADSVIFNFEGRFLDGTKFESTYDVGVPAVFAMGDLIQGWQEGLRLIRPGDAIMLYIPSKLAFGEEGSQSIEPNKGLIFRIDLLRIIRPKR